MTQATGLNRHKTPIDAAGIATLLRKRYPAEEYAVLYEVRDGTGFHANRSADAIVVNLWPSRGLEIQGFEFKVSRNDWLKELRNPAKAEAIAAYCDRWWVCVSDAAIIQPGELPTTWGLMVPRGNGLRVVVEAQKRTPIALDRLFVAAVCRSAQKHSPGQKQIEAAVAAAKAEWDKERTKSDEWARKHKLDELDTLRHAVKEFEEASGVHIRSYDARQIGEAVRVVMRGDLKLADSVEFAAKHLDEISATLKELAALPALREPVVSDPKANGLTESGLPGSPLPSEHPLPERISLPDATC